MKTEIVRLWHLYPYRITAIVFYLIISIKLFIEAWYETATRYQERIERRRDHAD